MNNPSSSIRAYTPPAPAGCFRTLLRPLRWRWGEFQLRHAPAIRFRSTYGQETPLAHREGGAIDRSWTFVDILLQCIIWILGWFWTHVPTLQVVERAGDGSTAEVFRAIYCDHVVILKRLYDGEVARREWDCLKSQLPSDRVSLTSLPIPTYYGLFTGKYEKLIVMSDAGYTLNPRDVDEHMR